MQIKPLKFRIQTEANHSKHKSELGNDYIIIAAVEQFAVVCDRYWSDILGHDILTQDSSLKLDYIELVLTFLSSIHHSILFFSW
jgi:hypothetical protein